MHVYITLFRSHSFQPDMRYYNEVLRELPPDKITIPMIIHAMAEQVNL